MWWFASENTASCAPTGSNAFIAEESEFGYPAIQGARPRSGLDRVSAPNDTSGAIARTCGNRCPIRAVCSCIRIEPRKEPLCGTAPLSLCAQGCYPGLSRPVPCLVQSAHAALGTAQGDQRSRVPDRTAGPRLAHAARLSALADTALIRRALPRPRVIGHPRPRALRAAGQARSCV